MRRGLIGALSALLIVVLVGPFLIPVPPLEDTVPPHELADADSRFLVVDGVDVHFKTIGHGTSAFLLLHGFGASTFTWHAVWQDLGLLGRTVAYDRPGFGLTSRPVVGSGSNPYAGQTQPAIALALLDALHIDRAILIGNSAGGRVAVDIALAAPERVRALVLISPAIGTGGPSLGWLRPLMHTPQLDRLGPWFVRSIRDTGLDVMARAWHEPERLTDAVIAGYRRPLGAHDWDRALWEVTRAPRQPLTDAELGSLSGLPTLVVTGDDDRIVAPDVSERAAAAIPDSRFEVIQQCGHVPQEECPEAFMNLMRRFLSDHNLEVAE